MEKENIRLTFNDDVDSARKGTSLATVEIKSSYTGNHITEVLKNLANLAHFETHGRKFRLSPSFI